MNNLGTASNPGIKTTELWVTVLSMILTFLSIRGVIQASDINPILNAFMQVYGGVVGLLTLYAIAAKYVSSRTAIKTKQITAQPILPIANTEQVVQ